MVDTKLEDYRLEIKSLQITDEKRAMESGFETKEQWYHFIMEQEKDDIADAIINISERYEVPLQRVALDFDSTMIMRVGKTMENNANYKTLN